MCSKPTGGTSQYLYFFSGFFSLLFSFFERSFGERERSFLPRLLSRGERDRRRLLSRSRERERWRRDLWSRERDRDERRWLRSSRERIAVNERRHCMRPSLTGFVVSHESFRRMRQKFDLKQNRLRLRNGNWLTFHFVSYHTTSYLLYRHHQWISEKKKKR